MSDRGPVINRRACNFLFARCPVCHVPWPTLSRKDLRLSDHPKDLDATPCEGAGRLLDRGEYGEEDDPRFPTFAPGAIPRLDHLAKAFEACHHPHARAAGTDWCNLCGAKRLSSTHWVQPHYRDILILALQDLP